VSNISEAGYLADKVSLYVEKTLFTAGLKFTINVTLIDLDRIIILVVLSNKSVPPPRILCQIDRRSLCEFKN